MIALRDNLPLVRFGDGRVHAFERGWLCGALAESAAGAGYPKWWLAPHVAESVTRYLEQDFDENVIPVCRLEQAVRSVLQVIGYADVAGAFRGAPAPGSWRGMRGRDTSWCFLICCDRVCARRSRRRPSALKFAMRTAASKCCGRRSRGGATARACLTTWSALSAGKSFPAV